MRAVALTIFLCALGCRALPTAANFEYPGEDDAVGADADVLADAAQDGDGTLADASESDSTDATGGDVGPDAAGDEADTEFDADVAVDAVIDLCVGKNCDDSNSCTTDSCDTSGACVHTVTATCDDGNPCTADACAAGGCEHTNTTASCNDGNACTTGDVCALGKCAGRCRSAAMARAIAGSRRRLAGKTVRRR